MAPQLAYRLGDTVHVGRGEHAQIIGRGQRPAGDEGQAGGGLDVFLLGVVDEAGVEGVPVLGKAGVGLLEVRRRLGDQLLGGGEVAAVDTADSVGGEPDRIAAEGQRLLTGAVLGCKVLAGALRDLIQAVGVHGVPSHRSH